MLRLALVYSKCKLALLQGFCTPRSPLWVPAAPQPQPTRVSLPIQVKKAATCATPEDPAAPPGGPPLPGRGWPRQARPRERPPGPRTRPHSSTLKPQRTLSRDRQRLGDTETTGYRGSPRPNRRPPPSSLRSSAIWASPRQPRTNTNTRPADGPRLRSIALSDQKQRRRTGQESRSLAL